MAVADLRNVFAAIPGVVPEELTQTLANTGRTRIERIVSLGHCSPPDFWYDQDEHEWVLLLQGAARLRLENEVVEGEVVDLRPGDFLNIPARRKHRVDWTTPEEPTIWLAVFYR